MDLPKFIQIATSAAASDDLIHTSVHALAEDGSVWEYNDLEAAWEPLEMTAAE